MNRNVTKRQYSPSKITRDGIKKVVENQHTQQALVCIRLLE